MAEVLGGMLLIKISSWEINFTEAVAAARSLEVLFLRLNLVPFFDFCQLEMSLFVGCRADPRRDYSRD
jgi:hypothetical protein